VGGIRTIVVRNDREDLFHVLYEASNWIARIIPSLSGKRSGTAQDDRGGEYTCSNNPQNAGT
jgi:hypothetical protein